MAFSCFCLSWASIARAVNGSRSSGDRTDGLQGLRGTRAGAHCWAGGDKLVQALHCVCRMGVISSRWELSLLPTVLCSWQVLKPAEYMLTWTNITVVKKATWGNNIDRHSEAQQYTCSFSFTASTQNILAIFTAYFSI